MTDTKDYNIDFFTVRTANDSKFSFKKLLKKLEKGKSSEVWDDGQNQYKIKSVTTKSGFFLAEFCKYRMGDLPKAGSPIDDSGERELGLEDSEGLIEKNFFAYRHSDNVVVFQRNGNASRGPKLGHYISEIALETVTLDPILRGNSIERLLKNESAPTLIEASFARPTNRDLYPNDKFSNDLFNLMNKAGGSTVSIKISTDQRSSDKDRNVLTNFIKNFASTLHKSGTASVLKLKVKDFEEDGVIYPIDLVADRIYTTRNVKMEGRYPNQESARTELIKAFKEKEDEIYEVLGTPDNRIS